MSTTYELFEQWKTLKGLASDNAGAKALGENRQTVSNWRQGRNGSPAVIKRMAKDLGVGVAKVVIRAHMETVTNRADRAVWTEIAGRALRDDAAPIGRAPRRVESTAARPPRSSSKPPARLD